MEIRGQERNGRFLGRWGHPWYLLGLLALGAVYFLAAKLGLALAFSAEQVTAVWPPAGLALAALLLWGYRLWPAILLGAFLANVTTQEPPAVALAIAAGNTLEALAGAWLVNRWARGVDVLESLRGVLGLLVLGSLLASIIAASIGVTSLCLGAVKPWSEFAALWWLWWIGDATGAMLFAPVLLAWCRPWPSPGRAHRAFEAGALFLGLTVLMLVIFHSGPRGMDGALQILAYAVFPFVIWAALRLGQRGATAAILLAAGIAVWGTAHGSGPFVSQDMIDNLMLLQVSLASIAITGLLLGAITAERDLAERRRSVDYAVTAMLIHSSDAAVTGILRAIGLALDWELGEYCEVDQAQGVLRCEETWQAPATRAAGFADLSREGVYRLGEGLPGRVWQTRQPAWISDVTRDGSFKRAAAAVGAGVHAALAFPILHGGQVLGTMCFFSRAIRRPDPDLLHLFASVGSQLGLFIERRHSEEARQRSEALRQGTLESALDCIINMDAQGRIVEFNAAAQTTFGYSREQAIGRMLADLIIPQRLREAHRRGLARYLATGEGPFLGKRIESWAVRADGVEIPVELSITAVQVDGDRVFAGYVRDISQRKQAEEKLGELAQALESRVAQRTALAEQRAAKLQALAWQLVDAEQGERRRLARLMHDDLQQLLVAAKMHAELARSDVRDPQIQEVLVQIGSLLQESIERTRTITTDLSPPILYEAGLAVGLGWLARNQKQKYGLEVTVDAQGDLEPADDKMRSLIFEAVRELLFNVVKHAGVRQAQVSVRGAGSNLKIVVADQGRGCAMEGPHAPPSAAGGFGLLSIRERLELLGGQFQFHSVPGQGTQATLLVPAAAAANAPAGQTPGPVRGGTAGTSPPSAAAAVALPGGADASSQRASPELTDVPAATSIPEAIPGIPRAVAGAAAGAAGKGEARSIAGGKLRVLIAEDQQILRDGIAQLLQAQADMEVVGQAGDGLEAIALARSLHPQVVVMDVGMPRLGGLEATRRITAELPDVKVIGLSMHSEQDMAQAMCQAGACAYVTKDAPSSDLLAALRHQLTHAKPINADEP